MMLDSGKDFARRAERDFAQNKRDRSVVREEWANECYCSRLGTCMCCCCSICKASFASTRLQGDSFGKGFVFLRKHLSQRHSLSSSSSLPSLPLL
mmetsp:Transcript_29558/g.41211  ORF Transcript_29558/g.41211 Transcript_29558/m.41211 type:complete len:95 (-) Transcript_29558:39-323(-)